MAQASTEAEQRQERSLDYPHNCMERSNQEWVEALSGQADEAALEELRRRLVAGLRRGFQGNRSVDDGFVEDTAQEAVMKILGALDGFRGDSGFMTWSLAIASRTAWTELRRKRWKDVSLDDVLTSEERYDRAASPADFEAAPDRIAVVEVLRELVRTRLTERQRKVVLAELAGMPQQEIARRMGSNRNAIYKLVYDARKNLKRGLEEAGYGAEQVLAAVER